jgi:NAD(P)-dependent dehydrogenase (short-subunit alcohol dehydrogenase family)
MKKHLPREPQRFVITGAGRGIGLELARQVAARGDQVLATVRKPTAELSAIAGVEIVEGIDVADDAAADALRARVGDRRVDVLLLNAGILERHGLKELDPTSIRRQFEVNALAPLRIAAALAGQLGAGSKIAIVTSRMGSLADNGSGGYYGYRMSKAAVNIAGISLAHDLRAKGVAVVLLHPGYVRTGMTGGNGDVDAGTSAEGLLARIDELTLATSGRFFHANGSELPW